MKDDELLDAKQVASLLSCSISTVYKLVENSTIPFKRIGPKKLIFVRNAIVDWVSKEGTETINKTIDSSPTASIPDVRIYLKKDHIQLLIDLLNDVVQDNIENAYVEEEKEELYDLQCVLRHALIGWERNFRTGMKGRSIQ